MSSTETPPSAKSVCVMGILIRDFLREFRDLDVVHLHRRRRDCREPEGVVVPARGHNSSVLSDKSMSQPDA